ncbi:apolipoprotein N-acyltransferase [Crenothrix sp. D3]|nr:apolipoprotein N-acyltransferase [Crenothrix sp. D3]
MIFSHKYAGDFVAFIAGFLYTLAFAPFDYAYLVFIALSMLFASWQRVTPVRAMLRGYLFGLSAFGLGVSWVYVSIHDFGHASVMNSSAMTAVFVGFWAMFPALAGYLCAKFAQSNRVLLMPVLWLLVDYLRGVWVLDGFPWLLAGYSQLDTPLAGYIPIFGVYGTGFIVALSAALMLGVVWRKALVLLMLWAVGSYLHTVQWTQPSGVPLHVALIQGNITQDKKWLPENKLNTLRLYKTLTEQHWGVNIIVWPETSIPAYLSEVEAFFLMPLHQAAQQHHTDLIVSLPIKNEASGEKYNAVMTLGSHVSDYRKQHLLPFGEILPWQPLSGFVLQQLGIKLGNFTAGGDNQPLLSAGGYSFITSICYEDVFGNHAIRGLENAAYLINVTNDGWFGNSIEPHQHAQMARMRALETGRFLLRSTNTGLTAIVAPNGKLIQQLPLFEVGVLQGEITPMTGLTPYARLGDKPVLMFLVGLLVVGWLTTFRKSTQ